MSGVPILVVFSAGPKGVPMSDGIWVPAFLCFEGVIAICVDNCRPDAGGDVCAGAALFGGVQSRRGNFIGEGPIAPNIRPSFELYACR